MVCNCFGQPRIYFFTSFLGYPNLSKWLFYVYVTIFLLAFVFSVCDVMRTNRRVHERLKEGKPIFTDSLMRDEPNQKKDNNT